MLADEANSNFVAKNLQILIYNGYGFGNEEMIASNDQAQEDLHLFTTLISNVVVVAVGSGERINYLGSVANRMAGVASARQNNNMQNYKHMKTACLVCI